MQNKKEVELGSHEWALIDYKIQTITGKSSLKILSLHRYSHTQDEPQVPQILWRILPLKQPSRWLT